ncbi:MAG: hypothetical protein AAB035_00990 [Nitrospirota bacterium]
MSKIITHKEAFLNLRNQIDFYLRCQFKWSRTISDKHPTPPEDHRLHQTVKEFLALFDWQVILDRIKPQAQLVIADIGARNFALAPILDRHFRTLGQAPEIHGIEIDAYRRLVNFYTRADYGYYYAKTIPSGVFHPVDFLTWRRPLHIGFLLNPFVTREALLAWGLPLCALQPEKIFRHLFELLKPQNGMAVLSNVDDDEIDISHEIAKRVGFRLGEIKRWEPVKPDNDQPRYGTILYTT